MVSIRALTLCVLVAVACVAVNGQGAEEHASAQDFGALERPTLVVRRNGPINSVRNALEPMRPDTPEGLNQDDPSLNLEGGVPESAFEPVVRNQGKNGAKNGAKNGNGVKLGGKPSAKLGKTSMEAPAAGGDECGPYAGKPGNPIKGNGDVIYQVVPVAKEHLSHADKFGKSPTETDNTMTIETACAFNQMFTAAKAAGIKLTIDSAFRTLGRQKWFYDCYVTKDEAKRRELKCGSTSMLASPPGTSNHGSGSSLDINVGPKTGKTYLWMKENAVKYGFIRTVPIEAWHWEYKKGAKAASFT